MARDSLAMAVSLVGTYIVFLLFLLAVAMIRAARLRARQAASARIRPALETALVEYLAGGKDDGLFRQVVKTNPADVSDAILLFQTTVGGSARERLCGLALELGLVEQWCTQSRSWNVVKRRVAFTNLAYTCVYEPCLRVAGDDRTHVVPRL